MPMKVGDKKKKKKKPRSLGMRFPFYSSVLSLSFQKADDGNFLLRIFQPTGALPQQRGGVEGKNIPWEKHRGMKYNKLLK